MLPERKQAEELIKEVFEAGASGEYKNFDDWKLRVNINSTMANVDRVISKIISLFRQH